MNKETFIKIQITLETRIKLCELHVAGIKTTDDLKKLTIAQAQQLQSFCRSEEALMTKIVQCDLYHIIGMGELTPPQMMKFTYLVKEYLQYRNTIKAIAMNFDKVSTLPSLPVSASYKAHGFTELILTTGPDSVVSSEATELPYTLVGSLVRVPKERVTEFITFWSRKSKVNFSETNFIQKAEAGVDYGGAKWGIDNAGNYVGVCTNENTRALFAGCYKVAQKDC